MNTDHSRKPPPFPTPQFYTLGTTAIQPFLLEPPTHDYEFGILPKAHSQYPSVTQSRSPDHVPHPSSRSRPHSRHTNDPFDTEGRLLTQSTPKARSEDPLQISGFESPKNFNSRKMEPRPELSTKKFDDLGLPNFDLRYQLPEFIATLGTHRFELKQPSVTFVRIISRAFPWNIDVTKSRNSGNITWKDMLEALYNGLQKQIENYEWPLLIFDRDPRYKIDIETIANTRINDPNRTAWTNLPVKPDHSKGLGLGLSKKDVWRMKRIDFLGHKTTFLGFKQDKGLEEMKRMPFSKPMSDGEVWVAELGSSRRRSGQGRR